MVLKNHCSSFRASTTEPHRLQRPSWTCSFASTVWSLGHHFTSEDLRYASPASRRRRNSHWFQRMYSSSCVDTSRSQSIAQPTRFIVSRMLRMFRSTISRGCPPSSIAAFSAGRPNESKPIGRSTS